MVVTTKSIKEGTVPFLGCILRVVWTSHTTTTVYILKVDKIIKFFDSGGMSISMIYCYAGRRDSVKDIHDNVVNSTGRETFWLINF